MFQRLEHKPEVTGVESTLQSLGNLRMRTIIGQRTGKLVGPGLTTLLGTYLTELDDIGCHITHIIQGEANHIRHIGQGSFACSIIKTLLADIAINHRHEGQSAHKGESTLLLSVVIYLIIEGRQSKDGLSRGSAHLLQVGESSPVEHLLGIGLSIGHRTTAIATAHRVAVGIRNSESLSTHDDSLME